MMNIFKVWCEEGETSDDAIEIDASDAGDAAERWAKEFDNDSYELAAKGKIITIMVSSSDGETMKYIVHGMLVPTYSAYPI